MQEKGDLIGGRFSIKKIILIDLFAREDWTFNENKGFNNNFSHFRKQLNLLKERYVETNWIFIYLFIFYKLLRSKVYFIMISISS